jgi:uncharacterized protein Yka (UPF0111/DUF47 family)
MSLSYGWEKLHNAIHSLCGQGSQAARLINAVAYSLIHIDPKNDIPEDIRDEFKEFMDEITAVPAQNNEGSIQATINTLDENGLSEAIEKVIHFYDKVCRHSEP